MLKPNLAISISLAVAGVARGQTVQDIQVYFEDLMSHPPTAEVPLEILEGKVRPLETAPTGQVGQILPVLRSAAQHPSVYVRLATAIAFMDIALVRKDGAGLLAAQLDMLESFLGDPDSRIAESGLMMLGALKPLPPPQVIPILLRFAQRTDADTHRQARALTTALIQDSVARRLKLGSGEPDILAVLEHFASRALDARSRSALLDGIGLVGSEGSGVGRNSRLTALVVAGLRDPNPDVRKRGLTNLMRLGQEEIRRASVDVERLRTQDPNVDVRTEADKALRVMGGAQQ